ncbi:bacterial transcriptional activator domain-containing protein [Deinococcus sp. LM3]|uniref:bacterial transcriptional activator domain-containing protein n=1 Tax=Deinococcus sp. LM3 TaxID=1938608 RepID=UPI000992181B|nr:bacterial transcriptional activator domain-containing protein [Deinococcus sp. LM3]OOV13733.1 hypothetical protein BXU09_02420 [Deinococcus sp. LM3]
MKLLTFGGVSVEGVTFRREKPLLLLAYLCLEGPQPRRRLASLFWPDAANPMNSLAQNLIRLRPLTGAVLEHGSRVEALIPSDTQAFRDHCRAARPADALTLYHGAFLDGLTADLNPDLEEWLLDTRETLAREARAAHLSLAEHHHARADHPAAHTHAERAYHTPGAPPCDPEDLQHLWQILGHTDHPLILTLRRDASDLGLALPAPTPPLPTSPLIGRTAELAALTTLPPGQIAWISGPPGIGKTALLSALAHHGWRVLPARGGPPLATLAPLSAHPLGSAADVLNLLRDTRLKLALDDWEDMDDITRAALTLAARQHPGATIAITARQPPALPTHHHLPLHSLTEHDLQGHPGAHAATGGHPTLLASYLNGTPPDRTLDAHLTLLGPDHRRLFLALAAQDAPNLAATRAALNFTPAILAATLDTLTCEGLTTPGGTLRASTPARQLLDAHPLDTALTHLHLARHHPTDTAWPHWLAARDLWEDHDHAPCAAAAHWHADQQMKSGHPVKAARTLEVAPQTDAVNLLRGWAQLRTGNATAAQRIVDDTHPAPPHRPRPWQILAAACALKLGHLNVLRELLDTLDHTGAPPEARTVHLRGMLALREARDAEARTLFRQAGLRFRSEGLPGDAVIAESLVAMLNVRQGQSVHAAFRDVLHASRPFPRERVHVLTNYVYSLTATHAPDTDVNAAYEETVTLAEQTNDLEGGAAAWNTWGVHAHLARDYEQAAHRYRRALHLVEGTGNLRLHGLIQSNLSELTDDHAQLAATLDLLSGAGHDTLSQTIQNNILR